MVKYVVVFVIFLCYFVNAQEVLEVDYDVYTVYDANKSEGFNVTINDHKLLKKLFSPLPFMPKKILTAI